MGEGCCGKGWKKQLEKSSIRQSAAIESMNTFWDKDTSWKSYIHKKDLSFWFPELENTDSIKIDYKKSDFIFFGRSKSKEWLYEVFCNESTNKELALCTLETSKADRLFNIPMKFEENADGVIPLVIPADESLARSLIEQRSSMNDLHTDEDYFKQAEYGAIIQFENDWLINYYKENCISHETFYFVPKKKKFIFLKHDIGQNGYCK